MPRTKADRTVIHRIEMGGWERERIDPLLTTGMVRLIGGPILKMASTLPGLAALYLVLDAIFPAWNHGVSPAALQGANEEAGARGIWDYLEAQNIILSVAGVGLAAWATGGLALIPTILGILGGQVVAEGAEEIYSDVEETNEAIQTQLRFVRLMLSLRANALEQGMVVD